MTDDEAMARAIEAAAGARTVAHPNPWVGCVVLTPSGRVCVGATQSPGGAHAETLALARAGADARGATAVITLEPCSHHGRTGPCAEALVDAGVGRVVIGLLDPDPRVSGRGVEILEAAGIEVRVGPRAAEVEDQLAPYLHQRRTGRPYVVAKLAASLDGRTAAPDGSSQWITGPAARADAHRLRAESDAVIVGAGTVRADDPALTVRHVEGPDPERIVLGSAPPDAAARPCREVCGDPGELLDQLGEEGMVQVVVEGGPTVVGALHRAGLVDRYVVYLAPVLFGGDDALGLFTGPGAGTLDVAWRGRVDAVERVGEDIRVELVPSRPAGELENRKPRTRSSLVAGSSRMFTGIVEELGVVESFDDGVLRIAASTVLEDAAVGDSIAVDGCCLTVTAMGVADGGGWWEADVSHETLRRTTLGTAAPGNRVNLERPVRAQDRLGGHIVQGHVDAVGEIVEAVPDLRVRMPRDLLKYVVVKGSVTVDGVSLTVVDVLDDGFTVAVIPHTAEVTTLGRKGVGDPVNLEVDVTVKYVERLLTWKDS